MDQGDSKLIIVVSSNANDTRKMSRGISGWLVGSDSCGQRLRRIRVFRDLGHSHSLRMWMGVQFPQVCNLTLGLIETSLEVVFPKVCLVQSLRQLVMHLSRALIVLFEFMDAAFEKIIDHLQLADPGFEASVRLE